MATTAFRWWSRLICSQMKRSTPVKGWEWVALLFLRTPNFNHIHSCNFSLSGDKCVFTSPNLIIIWLLVLLILKLFSHKGLWMKVLCYKVKLRMKMDWWSQLSHYVHEDCISKLIKTLSCVCIRVCVFLVFCESVIFPILLLWLPHWSWVSIRIVVC